MESLKKPTITLDQSDPAALFLAGDLARQSIESQAVADAVFRIRRAIEELTRSGELSLLSAMLIQDRIGSMFPDEIASHPRRQREGAADGFLSPSEVFGQSFAEVEEFIEKLEPFLRPSSRVPSVIPSGPFEGNWMCECGHVLGSGVATFAKPEERWKYCNQCGSHLDWRSVS